jgi:hypothetical protein
MKAAIHQPNFFPWLGFFNKIKNVELFIFFDNVQRQQGKSWLTRVKLNINQNPGWLTIPIVKSGNSIQKIYESKIVDSEAFRADLINKLGNYYRNYPHTKNVLSFINDNWPDTDSISKFNGVFTELISKEIGMETRFVYCSDNEYLANNNNTGNQIIIDVCKNYNIDDYLSGSGCLDFFNPTFLNDNNISVNFQELKFKPYPQKGMNDFISGLSILDLLVNVGFDNANEFI